MLLRWLHDFQNFASHPISLLLHLKYILVLLPYRLSNVNDEPDLGYGNVLLAKTDI